MCRLQSDFVLLGGSMSLQDVECLCVCLVG